MFDLMCLVYALMLCSGYQINRMSVQESEARFLRFIVLFAGILSVITRSNICESTQFCKALVVSDSWSFFTQLYKIVRFSLFFLLLFGVVLVLNVSMIKLREHLIASTPHTLESLEKFNLKLETFK